MERIVIAPLTTPMTGPLTVQQMSSVLQNMQMQYDNDMQWATNIATAVEDHAGRLDTIREAVKETRTHLVSVRQNVIENDAEAKLDKQAQEASIKNMKDILDNNDADTKNIVEENDIETKRVLRDNDNSTKKELGLNDANLRANLALSEGKIEVLMQEAKRLQGLMDETVNNVEERTSGVEQQMGMLSQAAGNPEAIAAAVAQAQMITKQMQDQYTSIEQIRHAMNILEAKLNSTTTTT